jgi:septum formation protein
MSSMPMLPELYLASQSPRRRQLLENLGLSFTVVIPSVEEEHPGTHNVDAVIRKNSEAKAAAVAAGLGSKNAVVIGADTLVMIDQQVLGKPKDAEGAKAMLRALSGRVHTVVTGLALVSPTLGVRTTAVRSQVKFHVLPEKTIEEYTLTREPYDKAGSYAIQGMGALFIERIDGLYTNVMGLPIETMLEELPKLTGIPLYRWFL